MADFFFHPILWPFACLLAQVAVLLVLGFLEERERRRGHA